MDLPIISFKMVDKLLKASLATPELLNSLTIQQLSQPDLIFAFNVLTQTKTQPPLFYTQLVSSLLSTHYKYNPSVLALKEFDHTSVAKSLRNVALKYFKIKRVGYRRFELKESIEMIKVLSLLSQTEGYEGTAVDLLDYFCDIVVRAESVMESNEAAEVLERIWKFERPPAVFTLGLMCKAVILNDLKGLGSGLGFYRKNDEFFDTISKLPSNGR